MTCQDKSLLAPGFASTPVIPRYRQIIRKRAVLMLAIALAMMASLMVDVTCGSSGLPLSALWQALFQPENALWQALFGHTRYCLGYSFTLCPDGAAGRHGVRVSGRRNANHFK
ncbi:putative ABC transport protein [Salmonella enterica subsp. enterica serovar Give str. S5-487]|nr:putative ABC transport protein [Salmonella enterica subsp. enterica serovar Give str. S5-487]